MSAIEEIAAAAARLIVDEGMEYGAAKRRAARDFGRRGAELPSNEAVEDQVREHIALFCADTQPAELQALREVALLWMERLAAFRPHLGGAVWRGTATRLSTVRLELYCDDAKSAEHALIDKRVDYEVGALEQPGAEPVTVLTVASRSAALGEHVTVHMSVLDHDDLRGALKPDSRGRSWRGDLAALRTLMAVQSSEASQ
jgi:hypothetical protein